MKLAQIKFKFTFWVNYTPEANTVKINKCHKKNIDKIPCIEFQEYNMKSVNLASCNNTGHTGQYYPKRKLSAALSTLSDLSVVIDRW